jgi:cytochrome P450
LHKQYGPIVRINPFEIHINDPEFYHEIYVEGRVRTSFKWMFQTDGPGLPGSVVMTKEHDVHKMRRGALNNFFGKRQVLLLEPVMQDKINRLMEKLGSVQGHGRAREHEPRVDGAEIAILMKCADSDQLLHRRHARERRRLHRASPL